MHKYTLEFQDLCTVGIVVKAITLLPNHPQLLETTVAQSLTIDSTSSLPFDLAKIATQMEKKKNKKP